MCLSSLSTLLTPELLAQIGNRGTPKEELVTRRDIRKYSVATGQRLNKFLAGDEAPPMFHLALFWDVVELDKLTPDGVWIDQLVPEFPLKRAMAGGVKISYYRRIIPADVLIAKSTLTDIYEKQGSQGPLIFYVISTEIETSKGEPVLTEVNTRIMR
jgi:hydroxyacyl-ACP dehydratase HTD2-like protein with hotdog domain